eukprot:4660120-Pleurochrysis_carterae.AAC.1
MVVELQGIAEARRISAHSLLRARRAPTARLRESVQERARQPLAPAALLQRILAAEDAETRRALELGLQLRDVDRCPTKNSKGKGLCFEGGSWPENDLVKLSKRERPLVRCEAVAREV